MILFKRTFYEKKTNFGAPYVCSRDGKYLCVAGLQYELEKMGVQVPDGIKTITFIFRDKKVGQNEILFVHSHVNNEYFYIGEMDDLFISRGRAKYFERGIISKLMKVQKTRFPIEYPKEIYMYVEYTT